MSAPPPKPGTVRCPLCAGDLAQHAWSSIRTHGAGVYNATVWYCPRTAWDPQAAPQTTTQKAAA